jgi:diguanylate cyclase (GGDEF)-like protein
VLCAIAGAIVRTIRRPADMAGRYGGEEFVALLPDTEMAGALKAAESLRAAIIDLAIPHIGSPFGGLTVSIGAAVMYPHPAEASATLLKMADEALYEAKRAGRNRVCARAAEYADAPAQPDPAVV